MVRLLNVEICGYYHTGLFAWNRSLLSINTLYCVIDHGVILDSHICKRTIAHHCSWWRFHSHVLSLRQIVHKHHQSGIYTYSIHLPLMYISFSMRSLFMPSTIYRIQKACFQAERFIFSFHFHRIAEKTHRQNCKHLQWRKGWKETTGWWYLT